ncbi:uncharacterized protein LOC143819120 isoform X2 [Paroedura picta]|uniref:uncharacterized protein LOC143819120 isoform X2 n=1 Tax=Paroedura picta TaxID=143630 RepID=UPI004055D3B6
MASKQRSRKQGKGQKKSPMTASKAAGGGRAASSQRQSSRRDSAAKAREAWASALPAVRPKGGGALQRGRNVSTSKSRPAATREARGSPEPLSISPSRGSGAGRPREKPAAKPVNQRRGRSVARQTRQQARGMAPSGGLSGQSSSQDGSPVTDSRKKSTSREKSAAAKRKHRSRAPIRPRARVIADSPASNESVDADSVDSESSSFISQASGTSRQVVSKGKRKNKKPYNNYWRGYARAFENISMAHRASGSSGRLSFSGESSEGTSGTSEESARVDRTSGTRHKRHSNSKGHKRRRSICSSPSSGESTPWDEGTDVRREGWFWIQSSFIPGIPKWMDLRRSNTTTLLDEAGVPENERAPPVKCKVSDAPPGAHLKPKLRERALEGYFVDFFALIPGQDSGGDTGSRRDKKKHKTFTACERTFDNWLKGYAVYLTIVAGSYPERGWHLGRYLSHILEARDIAGDEAAMEYDRLFRELASQNPDARWDLKHPDTWFVQVGSSAKRPRDRGQAGGSGRRPSGLPCWDFNNKGCRRRRCRFEHRCEVCGGGHPLPSCPKGGMQMPFRTARPSGKKDGGSGTAGPSSSAKTT